MELVAGSAMSSAVLMLWRMLGRAAAPKHRTKRDPDQTPSPFAHMPSDATERIEGEVVMAVGRRWRSGRPSRLERGKAGVSTTRTQTAELMASIQQQEDLAVPRLDPVLAVGMIHPAAAAGPADVST